MKIRYFAWIRELTKNDEEYLDSNEIQNLKKLKNFLSTKYIGTDAEAINEDNDENLEIANIINQLIIKINPK